MVPNEAELVCIEEEVLKMLVPAGNGLNKLGGFFSPRRIFHALLGNDKIL